MHAFIETQKEWLRTNLPPFRAGDTLCVNVRVKEGEKERIQAFEGVCIARRGSGVSATFTVRNENMWRCACPIETTRPLSLCLPTPTSHRLISATRQSPLFSAQVSDFPYSPVSLPPTLISSAPSASIISR